MLRFSTWLSTLSACLLFVLMLITAVDVIGRYVFNNPLASSTELIEFTLGLFIFSSLPLLCKNNDHITVDLLEDYFSAAFRRKRDIAVRWLTGFSMLTLSYGLWLLGKRAQRDELVSEILALPVAWFLFIIAGFALIATVFTFIRRSKSGTVA
ncbi:MAG: TRAP transporter small permease [Proteobacteria bacterium]|nr:TRAP transporter small permease [Pseudomonadota bacterium]MCH9757748.1 TRAP transporter small permease [Pseudomonadota bacterium]